MAARTTMVRSGSTTSGPSEVVMLPQQPQQLLLLIVLEMGKAALIVPIAVMGAVVVLMVGTAGFLFIVNAYLRVFVKIWREINVNSNVILCLLEDFGRNQFNNPCPACEVGDWCVY